MTIAIVRDSGIQRRTGGAGALDYSFPSLPAAGNAIVTLVASQNGEYYTVTDNQSGTNSEKTDCRTLQNGRWVTQAFIRNAIATPIGTYTVSVTPAYSADEIQFVVLEISGVGAECFELGAFVSNVNWSSSGNQTAISSGVLSQADCLVLSWLNGRTSAARVLTPPGSSTIIATRTGSAFSDSASGFTGQVVAATTSVTHTWSIDNASGVGNGALSMLVLKGGAPTPAISSGTAAPVHLSTGNTVTGINFGASQTGSAGLAIGGTGQTETAWGATSITYTADRGVNLNGVAVNAVVTDSGGTPSANYALTGFQPPAGYEYVTLTSVNSTADYRITAIADLAIGNQLEWDEPLVTINPDGTYVADPSVTEFYVRIGVTGDGWGALALQTVNAASPGGANSATGGRIIRPFNKRVGIGF